MKKKIENKQNSEQLNILAVSSSTVIEPINCELSENMKAQIEMLERITTHLTNMQQKY